MKKLYTLIAALVPVALFSQTVFWSEDFGTGCDQGQLATSYTGTNGAWTMVETGVNTTTANTWFVSATSNGNPVGQCTSPCGNNRTLHISTSIATTLPAHPIDDGAIYLVGMAGFCDFLPCGTTNKRVESPTINCTGRSNITLSFKYIEGGGSQDNATLVYFDGTAWQSTPLADMNKTPTCGSDGGGIWTQFSIALPASANNNPNVKIGFNWSNAESTDAVDPSVAIDDITLSVTDTAPTCCDGDFNCDGVINVLDMIIIVNQFGCMAGCTADLNNDGAVGAADLTIFNGLYGIVCP